MDSNAETAKDLEGHTEALSNIIGHFRSGSIEHQREEFLKHITDLQRELLLVRNKVEELKSIGTLRKVVASAEHAETLKGYQDMIRTTLEELQLLANINTTNLLNELYNVEVRKEQRRLLDRLGDASYGASGNVIKDVICLPGTRVEVLERIDDWVRNASERVLWIRGMAGRGKSTLASTVAYNWRCRAAIAIFHFRRGQNALDSRLICSLARQLGNSLFPEIKEAILQSIREKEDIAQERLEEQFKVLFLAPAGRLQHNSHPILIIIDALDECEDPKYMLDFFNLVHRYSSAFPRNFKFLLTTRPEAPLLQALEKVGWRLEDVDTIPTIDRDITEFLQQRFSVIRDNDGMGADWPPENSIRSLVEMSQGLFQWAQTAVEYIAGGSPSLCLEELLETPSLCDGLDKLYVQILSKAYEKLKKRPGRRELLSCLLGTLVTAPYPISLEVFISLFADEPMLRNKTQEQAMQLLSKEILCHLRSLIYVPEEVNQPMRLVHTSARDLLLDEQRCDGQPYFIDRGLYHRQLANSCLGLMMRDLRDNICNLSELSKSNSEVQDAIESNISKSLRYCCWSWSTHLIEGYHHLEPLDPSLQNTLDMLKSLSETKLLCWLEVMSLTGATVDSMTMAKTVRAWLQRFPGLLEVGLTAIWDDTYRFINSFLEPISFGAIHIYASALPFCPTKTRLWECYSSRATNRVLHGPQELGWSADIWTRSVDGGVRSLIFLHDGKVLASGCSDGTIRLWDSDTGTQIGEPIINGSECVVALALSSDGKIFASGSTNGIIRVWDAKTGDLLHGSLQGHLACVKSLSFSRENKTLTSTSLDGTVRFWDCDAGTSLGEPITLPRWTGILAISPKVKLIVIRDYSGTRLWDVETRTVLPFRYPGQNTIATFSPDDNIIAIGNSIEAIRLWDSKSREPILCSLKGYTSPVSVLKFSPDADILASGCHDCTIQLWDVKTGARRGQYQASHNRIVIELAFSPNGKMLASGSYDNTIRLWDVQTASCATDPAIAERQTEIAFIMAIAFSPNGKILAFSDPKGVIQLWDARHGRPERTIPRGRWGENRCLAFSPDGALLASGHGDTIICLWDTNSWEQLGELYQSSGGEIIGLVFAPNGKRIASLDTDGSIFLWDVSSRTHMGRPTRHKQSDPLVRPMAFSLDNKLLASSDRSSIHLWDGESGASILSRSLVQDRHEIQVELLPSGECVATVPRAVVHGDAPSSHKCDAQPGPNHFVFKAFLNPFGYFSFDGAWISFNSQRLWWFPPRYRPSMRGRQLMCQGTLAFGNDKGIVILDVSRSLKF